MTRRIDLLRKIAEAAKAAQVDWVVEREGGNHTIYRLGKKQIPVGRHAELGNRYAEMVYKQCEDELGRGWWRK